MSTININLLCPEKPALPDALEGYRSIPMKIKGTMVKIGGIAHPCLYNTPLEDVLKSLRKSYDVLISLEIHNTSHVKKIWERVLKGTHHTIKVEDFAAPSPEQLMAISQIATNAAEKNQSIIIHCKGGAGRTGTVLSALMLKSLVEQGAQIDFQKESTLDFSFQHVPSVKATKLVFDAVNAVRNYDTGQMSVEVPEQVEALEKFALALSKTDNKRSRL